jgi:type IV secretory pathway VirB2 component (pilin)
MEHLVKAHSGGWLNCQSLKKHLYGHPFKSLPPSHLKTLNKLATLSFISILCLLLLPNIAFAAGGDTPVGQGLGYIKDALLGTTGMMIATLAVMSMGLACLFHKLEWKYFGYTVAAIAIVFGAPAIVDGVVKLVK